MGLFSRKKETKVTETNSVAKRPTAKAVVGRHDALKVLLAPRVTEKAVRAGEKNVYTFLVHKDATKHTVKAAVKALYEVTPVRVNIVNKSPRQQMSRRIGRTVSTKGFKKAYVYLKDGDRIDLV